MWLPSLRTWALRWLLGLRSSSRCPSFFPPPSCDVRSGPPCCDEAALITGSWTVCGSRSVIILQPGGHAEITQSTSATWCGSQIYSHAPHITAVQVFKRCHICLNTGIKLGWRKRRNRSVTDSRREKRQEEGENDILQEVSSNSSTGPEFWTRSVKKLILRV